MRGLSLWLLGTVFCTLSFSPEQESMGEALPALLQGPLSTLSPSSAPVV